LAPDGGNRRGSTGGCFAGRCAGAAAVGRRRR
jgi:hypothetical protein